MEPLAGQGQAAEEPLVQPEGVAEGEAAPAPDPVALAAQIKELERRYQEDSERWQQEANGWRDRYENTAQWARDQSTQRGLAESIVDANRKLYEENQRREQALRELTPPATPAPLTAEEKSRLLDDPEALYAQLQALYGYVQRAAEFTHKATLAQVAPHLGYREPPDYDRLREGRAEVVLDKVKGNMVANGILTEEEFSAAVPEAMQILSSGGLAPHQIWNIRMDPNAMEMAVYKAATSQPRRVNAPKPAPTVGVNNGTRRDAAPPQKSDAVRHMEEMLGTKYKPEQLQKLYSQRG